MKNTFEIFDAARTELKKGVNLVEASAGTGKTYAIGMLVLRSLVELGIPIEKTLIVTFTKAATEELKSRIRARLVEARNLLASSLIEKEQKVDETLLDWLATIDDREMALNRVQLALAGIDLVGIFTIHGFCQRMLVEQALESGQLFDVELLTDIDHVRREVADDFWRSRVYLLAPLPCSLLTDAFPTPEKLLASVAGVFGDFGRIEPQVGLLEELLETLNSTMEGLVAWWKENSSNLHKKFSECLPQGSFKKGFTENFEDWFQSLNQFFCGESLTLPDNMDLLDRETLVTELNGNKIRGEENKRLYLSDWLLPDTEICGFLAAADNLLLTFRVLLAEKLRTEVRLRLEQQGNMGFNDLILRLSNGLKGDRGRFLKKVLGERFSMALIDEFQDTDSAQYHIFSTLFGAGDHYLYLIGDPKQAIYKFRGADIHSYFQARKSATSLLTLEKNYRSHPALIAEVNRLFGGTKPFYYEEEVLSYRRVEAAKQEGEIKLTQDGRSLAGMVYTVLEEGEDKNKGRWTSGKAAEMFRFFVAGEISRLLDPKANVILQTDEERPLAPHDIAILVRSNKQAEEYRRGLAEVSIPAVVGSRLSVFQTEQCQELMLLLQAIGSPGEITRLKTAMTIPWFGFTGNELHEIWQDEKQLNSYHNRFQGYNKAWQEQGFLPMMTKLIIREGVFVTLAAGETAERIIANIEHLLELVQEQENNENLGIGQMLQWLQNMMSGGKHADDAELLLESDEEAVRIVTMHSAKGLEYPVVFCPYLWYSSNHLKREKYQISCHDETGQVVIDLGSDQFDLRKEKAAEEDMAENLRLLYVALTRAKIRCYTMWGDVKPHSSVGDSFQSALGYLLFPQGYIDYQGQLEFFRELSKEPSIHFETVSADDSPANYVKSPASEKLAPKVVSGRSLYTDWQMSSYSAMASQSDFDQEYELETVPVVAGPDHSVPVPGLPAGPNFGNVVHDLLEVLPFSAVSRPEEEDQQVALLKQKCTRYGVEAEPGEIKKILECAVNTPLFPIREGENNFSLSILPETSCLKEMGFYFHLSRLTTESINNILADEPTVAPLHHKVMRGYLTGFVDLICESGGKYYVIDYKTNFLGEKMGDYASANLITAMQSHNYGLQYWIYTLVLHRHLQNLLPDYCYEHHFGGVMYLFVRGMSPDIPGSGVYFTLPDSLKLMELDRAIGGVENG